MRETTKGSKNAGKKCGIITIEKQEGRVKEEREEKERKVGGRKEGRKEGTKEGTLGQIKCLYVVSKSVCGSHKPL